MNQMALARAKLKNYRIQSNRTEVRILTLLHDNFPGKFMYNGGELIIHGMVPDFPCIAEPKVIIEFIGRRDFPKHTPEELEKREAIFSRLGFRTLFIFTEDLKDEDKLVEDILFFLHFGLK